MSKTTDADLFDSEIGTDADPRTAKMGPCSVCALKLATRRVDYGSGMFSDYCNDCYFYDHDRLQRKRGHR